MENQQTDSPMTKHCLGRSIFDQLFYTNIHDFYNLEQEIYNSFFFLSYPVCAVSHVGVSLKSFIFASLKLHTQKASQKVEQFEFHNQRLKQVSPKLVLQSFEVSQHWLHSIYHVILLNYECTIKYGALQTFDNYIYISSLIYICNLLKYDSTNTELHIFTERAFHPAVQT